MTHEASLESPFRDGICAHHGNAMCPSAKPPPQRTKRAEEGHSCTRDPGSANLSVPRPRLALSCSFAIFFYETVGTEKQRVVARGARLARPGN
ncbi:MULTISPECIES: hypothetical protein [Burkholderia]|uniref:hypothetical protein n=1 Tax=Burkholderia TaxID=32008 RepID=UPI000A450AEF|nr:MULTISPECIES: hypothetical protein [Burkholderia]